jgi:hypothetical protein
VFGNMKTKRFLSALNVVVVIRFCKGFMFIDLRQKYGKEKVYLEANFLLAVSLFLL